MFIKDLFTNACLFHLSVWSLKNRFSLLRSEISSYERQVYWVSILEMINTVLNLISVSSPHTPDKWWIWPNIPIRTDSMMIKISCEVIQYRNVTDQLYESWWHIEGPVTSNLICIPFIYIVYTFFIFLFLLNILNSYHIRRLLASNGWRYLL